MIAGANRYVDGVKLFAIGRPMALKLRTPDLVAQRADLIMADANIVTDMEVEKDVYEDKLCMDRRCRSSIDSRLTFLPCLVT
jgi:hypothetical protein